MSDAAVFSPDRKYRYVLRRRLTESGPTVAFIGLNPSTADELQDDPTIRRCMGYARLWDFGKLVMLNLFAFRSTDPRKLCFPHELDPVGPENDEWLRRETTNVTMVVACWGNWGELGGRGQEVRRLIAQPLFCLGITARNEPVHPLYQPKNAKPRLLVQARHHAQPRPGAWEYRTDVVVACAVPGTAGPEKGKADDART